MVSSAMRFCFSGGRNESVSMLWTRSASFKMTIRMSSAIARNIFRKLSAVRSLPLYFILLSLVTPSTMNAISLPNSFCMSVTVYFVSSQTSCKNAAAIAGASRRISTSRSAVASGCEIYASPDFRFCPSWALRANSYARRRSAISSSGLPCDCAISKSSLTPLERNGGCSSCKNLLFLRRDIRIRMLLLVFLSNGVDFHGGNIVFLFQYTFKWRNSWTIPNGAGTTGREQGWKTNIVRFIRKHGFMSFIQRSALRKSSAFKLYSIVQLSGVPMSKFWGIREAACLIRHLGMQLIQCGPGSSQWRYSLRPLSKKRVITRSVLLLRFENQEFANVQKNRERPGGALFYSSFFLFSSAGFRGSVQEAESQA